MTTESGLYKELGQRLREVRQERGFTQDQVAAAISLERTSITNIESGRQRLPLHTLYEYCSILGIAVSEVLPTSPAQLPKKQLLLKLGKESVLVPASVREVIDRRFSTKGERR